MTNHIFLFIVYLSFIICSLTMSSLFCIPSAEFVQKKYIHTCCVTICLLWQVI